jgi:hypothetical protein
MTILKLVCDRWQHSIEFTCKTPECKLTPTEEDGANPVLTLHFPPRICLILPDFVSPEFICALSPICSKFKLLREISHVDRIN